MDISTITVTSHLLNIKEKLFPSQKDQSFIATEKPDISKYCSLFLQYSHSQVKETLELVLAKRAEFTVPIRSLDWLFHGEHLEAIQANNYDIPKLLLISNEGLIIDIQIESVLQSQIRYRAMKGKKLKKALDSLCLQCTYADGHKVFVQTPPSLKQSVYSRNNV